MTTPSAIEHLIEKMDLSELANKLGTKLLYDSFTEFEKRGLRPSDLSCPGSEWYVNWMKRLMPAISVEVINAISASGTHAVVPVKANVAMITAAENAQAARYFAKEAGEIVPHKELEVVIWDAMLAAAPKVGE